MKNFGVGFADFSEKYDNNAFLLIRARRAHHIYSLFTIQYSLR